MLTFAAPAFLWALAALPVVILLHLARRRRRSREVAGLFLWHRAREVTARRPRPRPTWLLLLQLLAVAALALALARPQLAVSAPPDRVLVIDASASMAARDPDGVRLDKARAAARDLLDAAGRVAVVRMGREAQVVQPFTDDRGRLSSALQELRAADDRAEAGRALELARALLGAGGAAASNGAETEAEASGEPGGGAADGRAAPDDAAPAGEIHWISDAPPPSQAGGVTVHDVAGAGRNVGLVSFDIGFDRAYLALASSYPRPQQVPVELLRGERVVATTDVLVPASGRLGVTLPVEPGSGVLRARIQPPAGDALVLDDEAWAGARAVDVVLDAPFAALERALSAIPGTRVRVTGAARSVPADLRVLTWTPPAPAPEALPAGNLLLLPDPELEGETVRIDDWDRADPLLRFVDLRDVRVSAVAGADPEPADGAAEGAGADRERADGAAEGAGEGPEDADGEAAGEVLVRAFAEESSVPLLTRVARDDATVWRFGFHPSRSDLVLRPAFPALIVNLIRELQGEQRVQLGAPLPEGATLEGEPVERALLPGVYRAGGSALYASLLSEAQTRLPGPGGSGPGAERAGEEAGPEEAREGASAEGRGGEAARGALDLAPYLLALALLALVAEWWWWSGGAPRRAWVDFRR